MRKFVCVFVFLCMVVASDCLGADLTSVSLGDTIYNKPNVVQYFYSDDTNNLSVKAVLGDEALNVETIGKAADTGIKTNYLFLVDESTSISSIQMEKIKEALNNVADTMAANETMSVIAFGKDIEVRADHTSDKAAVKAAVATLINNKGGTVFFDVIKKAGEICNASADERNLVFIISDGIDFNTGGYTYEEIEKYVTKEDLSVFAIALGQKGDAYIDKFGQLARNSHGAIEVCSPYTISENTLKLVQMARNCNAVVMKSGNNKVDENAVRLIMTFAVGDKTSSLEKTLYSDRWLKDEEPPHIVSLSKSSDTSVTVEFSENVVGADNPANYKVVLDGKHELNVDSVNYDAENYKANLVFEKNVYNGEYTVECYNITDDSMEKNLVDNTLSQQMEGQSYEAEMMREAIAQYWLLFVFVMLLVFGLVAFLVINSRKGIIVHDKKLKFRDSMVDKERIITPQTNNITLVVTNGAGLNKKVEMSMYKSLIVGRSEMCDLSFADNQLSRQHFAIEENNNVYTVMNLSSTNGTFVNGVMLSGKHKLEYGDVIAAGNEKFVFYNK